MNRRSSRGKKYNKKIRMPSGFLVAFCCADVIRLAFGALNKGGGDTSEVGRFLLLTFL
jgi:hypothetical protein